MTITESKKRQDGNGFERHKIFLYKEDFNRFVESLQDAVNHVKDELLPDYDYDEFTRRHEEYEARRREEQESGSEEETIETSKELDEEDLKW